MKKWLCIILAMALALTVVSGCKMPEATAPRVDPDSVTVTALGVKDGLAPADARFTVTFGAGKRYSAEQVKALMRFDPELPFEVKKEKDSFVLIPGEPLQAGKVYNVQALSDAGIVLKSWAFQTQEGFRVKSTTPYDGEGYADTTTGVEVIFTLSDVTPEDFAAHFTLQSEDGSEAVDGTVQKQQDRIAFVPKKALSPDTVYVAAITPGLTTPDGTRFEQDYSFSFRTTARSTSGEFEFFENYSPLTETFVEGDTPVVAVNCDSSFSEAGRAGTKIDPIQVEIYRYKSAGDYEAQLQSIAAAQNQSRFPDSAANAVNTAALDNLGTQSVSLTWPGASKSNYWGPSYVVLPQPLEAGWYYLRLTAKSPGSGKFLTLDKFVQINSLSVFHAQSGGETTFWLNDAASGKPAASAKIALTGDAVSASGEAAADGTATLQTLLEPAPAKDGQSAANLRPTSVLRIESGENPYIDLFSTSEKPPLTERERYAAYLYTDRPIYMSSDKVRVWGVVRPRAGVSEAPKNLRVTLGSDLYTAPVELAPDGSFTAEIVFDRLGGQESSYQSVSLLSGDTSDDEWSHTLTYVSITVGDYVKPTYVPSVQTDKLLYWAGETANVTFEAKFFDNTPAAGFAANLWASGMPGATDIEEAALVTDATGRAVQPIKLSPLPANEYTDWRPMDLSYSVMNSMGENENFNHYSSLKVLYHDTAVRAELTGTKPGEQPKITVRTNLVDPARIEQESDLYENGGEKLLGAPCDLAVTAQLHKVYSTKRVAGSYYNWVEKKNVPFYEYTEHDDVVSTVSYATKNGVFELTELPPDEADVTYYYTFSVRDGDGKTVSTRVYLGSSYLYRSVGTHHYTFKKDVTPPKEDSDYSWNETFQDAENVRILVEDNGMPVREGRVFWMVIQKGILRSGTEGTPAVSIPYGEELVPNYRVEGAFFDGKYIYPVSGVSMNFDPALRALEIAVKPDQEQYAPGGEAKVEVSVTNKATGSPVADAAVSLSVVDEAVFAIQEQEVRILDELYKYVFNTDVSTYVSYHEYDFLMDSAAEKGGGGGDSVVRADFQDTAAFLTAVTGPDGKATLAVKLPDNITSWRATAQAVDGQLNAGHAVSDLIATRDFFLNPVLADTYLEGDDAYVVLRAVGTGLALGSTVDYTVTLEDGTGGKTESNSTGKAEAFTALRLGALAKGTYTLTMHAKSGEKQDAVQKTLQVVSSGVEADLSQEFSLSEGLNIDPKRFPVQIGFYNEDYATWAEVLSSVSSATGGRTDARIARRYAREQFNRLEGLDPSAHTQALDSLTDVITESGYVALLPYDSPDIKLAALVHLATPEYLVGLNSDNVFNYIRYDLNANVSDVAASYLGLAAHKAPVLPELRGLLEQAAAGKGPYDLEGKLYLVAALAALGDTEGAKGYYESIIRPLLKEGTTGAGAPTLYLEQEELNRTIQLTALASLSASLIRNADADGMMRYLMANPSTLDRYELHKIVYLRAMEPQGDHEAKVSYRKDGKQVSLDLSRTGMELVRFTAEGLADANIKAAKGNVKARAWYVGSAADALDAASKTAQVTRTIESVDGNPLKIGSIAKVTIQVAYPDNHINPQGTVVNDYIPSGMRFLATHLDDGSSGKGYDYSWRLGKREGQRVMFRYTDYNAGKGSIEPKPGETTYEPMPAFSYYVRCATPGAYVLDGTFTTALGSPSWGMSERGTVEIGE